MTKFILSTLFVFTFLTAAFTQQEAQYTHFMYNQQMLNPAYAGVRGVPSALALYRQQWTGFNGAPKSGLVSFSTPLFNESVGFGLSASNRQIGVMDSWYASMAYAYNLKISNSTAVRIGLQGSIEYLTLNFGQSGVIIREENDNSLIDGGENSEIKGNVGLGAFLHNKNFYLGLSVPNLYPNDISFNQQVVTSAVQQAHVYAMAGLMLPINDNLVFKPALLTKYTKSSPISVDVNLSLEFAQLLTTGLSYRSGGSQNNTDSDIGDSIDLLLFYQVAPQFGVGIAYDFTLSQIRESSNGTFEVAMRYEIKKERKDLENPRFF